ncbi:hypothetical protein Ahy_A02g008374 isoform B [Arachis hypogaea]|uniref:Uncharacterized protein n=1 Tax=Arachis hypogaea TaxID=3818 RepID=A0A445EF08_ARAHY|nr:hypothetical protein Ahy_A02g008374 isoform B [Arachis hypogaea]
MYKERANLYGLYPKTWKGMLLCQQQKLKPTELLILSRLRISSNDSAQMHDFLFFFYSSNLLIILSDFL